MRSDDGDVVLAGVLQRCLVRADGTGLYDVVTVGQTRKVSSSTAAAGSTLLTLGPGSLVRQE